MSAAGLKFDWEVDVGGWGVGSISKNHRSHQYKSTKQFLLIAYLKTSGLNGSERTLCKVGATFLLFLKTKVKCDRKKIVQAKNCTKEKNSINIFATNCIREQLTMIS